MNMIEEIETTQGEVRIIETTNGPLAADYLAEISGEDWEIQRWFFFDEFEMDEAKQFGVKLLYDSEFRQASLNGEASWIQAHDLYLSAEQTIVDSFSSKDLFEYEAHDFEAEQRADWAEHKLMRMLNETHLTIKYTIGELSLSSSDLQPYLNAQFKAAEGVAAMVEDPSSVSVEDVRPVDRWFECRGGESREWIVEDNLLSVPALADVYVGEYDPVVALRSQPELQTVIKEFDWEKTHRTWNEERGVWELDSDSVEYVVEEFEQQNRVIRIADQVARIADIDTPNPPEAVRPEWHLPTMRFTDYEQYDSGTDLLTLPGIGPHRARMLLKEGFASLSDLADASVEEIATAQDITQSVAQAVQDSASAAVGDRFPAAVEIASKTPLPLSKAQQEIAGLAASGYPPSKTAPALIEMYQSSIAELESISGRDLYYLYAAGYRSTEDILTASASELAETQFISGNQARSLYQEAQEVVEGN